MKAHRDRHQLIVTFGRVFGSGLGFVLVLTLMRPTLWGKTSHERAPLTISVFNEADVPAEVLSEAEAETSEIFREAGIEVQWLNCGVPAADNEKSRICREAVFPEHLHLLIARKSVGLKGETMGIAFQAEDGKGCYADLFYEPMEELHKSYGTNLASLLGHAAAHEIGHLLLGTNSHAVAGIMQAHWTAAELATNARRLLFLDDESQRMRKQLLVGRQLQVARDVVLNAKETLTVPPSNYVVFGATVRQETLLRAQIRIMRPTVLPLRVFFVPHWKYLDDARTFRLHLPIGYTSTMFTHLPSSTVFIDNDQYQGEEWLGYWMAHELGHLKANSAKESDAERPAREYRKRLKQPRTEVR